MLAAAALLASAEVASAQSPTTGSGSAFATARVVSENATVRRLSAHGSEALTVVPKDSQLEVLDKYEDSYWVLLDRDAHGTRFAGWVKARDVEILTRDKNFQPIQVAPDKVKKPRGQKNEARAERANDRKLKKAEERMEKARRDLEKKTKGNSATAIAPRATAGNSATTVTGGVSAFTSAADSDSTAPQ
jgi:hypothetical protein